MSSEVTSGSLPPVNTSQLEVLIGDLEARTARITESLIAVAEAFEQAPPEVRADAIRLAAETLLSADRP
ncbi:hypothetical protein EDD29_6160 [Actinocorallia herbida]|uniref:Uncharacterized protein n=1 Tax=Actinocorallia herbida TaxID=58109 RepID=A0A3N1D4M8_9ACTN|nr:hypothetical protein [Actinocorallia herbida]ROO88491.1 hypothetical protein EDD29_6160 [Actinocorallia herbida]